jgi:predicted DNA-binding antitoxin AbrB/MazE fold protein
MNIKTKFKDGTFMPLEKVKEVKEGEVVEIEIKSKKKFSWRGALKYRKESSVELQHKIKEIW